MALLNRPALLNSGGEGKQEIVGGPYIGLECSRILAALAVALAHLGPDPQLRPVMRPTWHSAPVVEPF